MTNFGCTIISQQIFGALAESITWPGMITHQCEKKIVKDYAK